MRGGDNKNLYNNLTDLLIHQPNVWCTIPAYNTAISQVLYNGFFFLLKKFSSSSKKKILKNLMRKCCTDIALKIAHKYTAV